MPLWPLLLPLMDGEASAAADDRFLPSVDDDDDDGSMAFWR